MQLDKEEPVEIKLEDGLEFLDKKMKKAMNKYLTELKLKGAKKK